MRSDIASMEWFTDREMRKFSRLAIMLCILAVSPHLFSANSTPAQDISMGEYQLKAAWLYRICKYTYWARKEPPNAPFIIAFMGKIPDGNELVIPSDKLLFNRKIITRKITKISEIKDCHVLFIYPSESYQLEEIVAYIADKDILSTSDTAGFAQKGVIINFYIKKDESVGFEVNRDAEQKASIKLHPQLFTIGTLVKMENQKKNSNKEHDRGDQNKENIEVEKHRLEVYNNEERITEGVPIQ